MKPASLSLWRILGWSLASPVVFATAPIWLPGVCIWLYCTTRKAERLPADCCDEYALPVPA